MRDNVNHPEHYTQSPFETKQLECIAFTRHMGFCDGNAFKYVWRAGAKGNAVEDLDKALFYIAECQAAEEVPSIEPPVLLDALSYDEKSECCKLRYKALRFIAAGLWESAEEYIKALRQFYINSAIAAAVTKKLNDIAFNFKLNDTVARMDTVTRALLVKNCSGMFGKVGTDGERFAGRLVLIDRKLDEGIVRIDNGEGHVDINLLDIIRNKESGYDSAE